MIRNYLKIAFRKILHYKLYSAINVTGLSIGIAGFIVIMLYVLEELSYDKYHTNSERIYRVINKYDLCGVGEESTSSPCLLAENLKNDYPEYVEETVRFFNLQERQKMFMNPENKVRYNEKHFFFCDPSVFKVFDFQIVKGDAKNSLTQINTAVITESMAKKYFGKENPLGKVLVYEGAVKLKITAVVKDVPPNSHFRFDILISMITSTGFFGIDYLDTWVWNPFWTYVLLKPNIPQEALEAKLPEFVRNHFDDAEKDNISLYLQKLTDIHLKSDLDFEIEPNSNIAYTKIFSFIAFFILIIAIINYVNLSTASSAQRAGEIAVKKVVGSSRFELLFQFLLEAIFLSFIAVFFGLIIVEISLPFFAEYIKIDHLSGFRFKPLTIGLIIFIGLLTGVLSGLYPSFYLSSFDPILIFRKRIRLDTATIPRKILLITQFVISSALVIGTVAVYMQLNYIKKANLGFQRKNILLLTVAQTPLAFNFERFKTELLKSKDILYVTGMDYIIGVNHNNHNYKHNASHANTKEFYPTLLIRHDFLKTFNIKTIAGRGYSKAIKDDNVYGIMVNESLTKRLGWTPENAIGKKFHSYNGKEKIIGVIEDVNIKSLHIPIGPLVLNMKQTQAMMNWYTRYIAIRFDAHANKERLIRYIEYKWKQFSPERPFEYTSLEEEISMLYIDENKLGKLTGIFSVLAIFIACLGIVGLNSFLAGLRTKEIGIRKVMGASVFSVVMLVLKEFAYLISIANIIAWPLSYFIINKWLDSFAYRIELSVWIFIGSTLSLFLIASGMVARQIYWAAVSNPIRSLRYE